MTDGVIVELAPVEAMHLRDLIDELLALLGTDGAVDDAALDRLAPNPYPDDDEAAAEYRRTTRGDLMDRRMTDAHDAHDDLDEFIDELEPAHRAALTPLPLHIPAEHIEAWMRTLTAMRLVVASRLGITVSDDHDFTDPRFHVYDWLGYRLDELIRLADERDAMAS